MFFPHRENIVEEEIKKSEVNICSDDNIDLLNNPSRTRVREVSEAGDSARGKLHLKGETWRQTLLAEDSVSGVRHNPDIGIHEKKNLLIGQGLLFARGSEGRA